jgi:hypothetical protein
MIGALSKWEGEMTEERILLYFLFEKEEVS